MGTADQERDVGAHWDWKLEATVGDGEPVLPSFGSQGLAVVFSVWECTPKVLGVLRPVLIGDPSGDMALSQDRPLSWLFSCIHAVPEGLSLWVCTLICQLQRKGIGARTGGKSWDLLLFSFPKAALLLPSPLC